MGGSDKFLEGVLDEKHMSNLPIWLNKTLKQKQLSLFLSPKWDLTAFFDQKRKIGAFNLYTFEEAFHFLNLAE